MADDLPTDPARVALRRAWALLEGPGGPPTYDLARAGFLRGVAFVYACAFAGTLWQVGPLLGERGLLPAGAWLGRVEAAGNGFWKAPTVFWLDHSDAALHAVAAAGLALSALALAGVTNGLVQLGMWAAYLSFVTVGQRFWSFGWESQLCELGFLAVLVAPAATFAPFPPGRPASPVPFWLARWQLFRLMLGAGLIKLRGDPCWLDLTCLDVFYETQPNPSPLSWYWHHAPETVLHAGVALNHVVELVGPFLVFGPRRVRHAGGGLQIAFQILLILAGNLAFINWLTIANALACFDDTAWARWVPRSWVARAAAVRATPELQAAPRRLGAGLAAAVVAFLSIRPVLNLASPDQVMNTTYDPFRLVNTYGLFGSITKVRREIVISGTSGDPNDPAAVWKEYELPCKPGDVTRRPCVIGPFHLRADWVAWFAGMGKVDDHPWVIRLVDLLLHDDPTADRLLARNPFPGPPPRAIRVERWRYRMAPAGSRDWWVREREGVWFPAITADDPRWPTMRARMGWATPGAGAP